MIRDTPRRDTPRRDTPRRDTPGRAKTRGATIRHTAAAAGPPSKLARPTGLWVAAAVILGWATALIGALCVHDVLLRHGALAVASIAIVTFWHTGMFITAHEAMHGLVAPSHPRLNEAIGRLCLALYGGLPYDRMRTAHHQHHRTPSSAKDPDYHEQGPGGAAGWYVRFLLRYAS